MEERCLSRSWGKKKKENRLNAKIIKEVFGIHGSGWRISGRNLGEIVD